MKNRKLALAALTFMLVLILAITTSYVQPPLGEDEDKDKDKDKDNVTHVVAYLLDTKEDETVKDEEELLSSKIVELKNTVTDYIEDELNNSGQISMTYYDIRLEKGFEINGDMEYHPASLSKLYIVITLYDLAHSNALDINSKVYYSGSDYEAGTGILQGMNRSAGYSYLTLSDYAIKYSDNIAYRMLNRTLGYNTIKDTYESIIGRESVIDPKTDAMKMSTNDAVCLLNRVYCNEDDNYLYSRMIENMKSTVFDDRIQKYLPENIVAHKIGAYSDYFHDAGIVYANRPYILAVFTKNIYDADEKIAQISKIIYEIVADNFL